MDTLIYKSNLNGSINTSPSKSYMQRAVACAILNNGKTIIYNPGKSKDDLTSVSIIKNLGAKVSENYNSLSIESGGINPIVNEIDFQESGLCARMFTPIIATINKKMKLNGCGSLLNRPFNQFEEILPLLNVEVKTNFGKLPISVIGPLVPNEILIDGSTSSQYLTGLLLSYAYLNAKGKTILVKNPVSRQYIDITLQILRDFKFGDYENCNYESFTLKEIKKTSDNLIKYTIEGDWSSASFILVAGAICGNIEIKGLNLNSLQPDKKIIEILKIAGSDLILNDNSVVVQKRLLKSFHFDATDCPDLFPPLVALASFCQGESVIEGVNRLKYKESDRGFALVNEFRKLNVPIYIKENSLVISGINKITGSDVNSHNDHRIAMALSVMGLNSENGLKITNSESVQKSYPAFFDDLKILGASIYNE